MTSEKDILDQIQREDILPYLNSVYDGFLPETLIDQFRIGIMLLAPTVHQYSMSDIRTMSTRRPNEVTVRELGMILNIVFAIAWASMYESLEEAIEKTTVFQKIKDEYNKKTAAFDRKVNAKKNRLMQLSGITNSAAMNGGNNGMRIIPNS